jgi:zinc transport system substrate-binding protein
MRRTQLLTGVCGVLLLAGCAGSPSDAPEPALTVSAGLYPLAFVAHEVGGNHVEVTDLAGPGIEPHDIELSPAAVRALANSDLVLHIGGFQPAVDAAIASTGAHALDTAGVIALANAEGGNGHDPHFWLDPGLLADYATVVADEYAQLDPENADTYSANAAALAASLEELDERYANGLAQCERRELVTSHEAFGYLARTYGLEHVAIAGIDPDAEPSPARIREIAGLVAATGATTIFAESAASTGVAESIARDAGMTVEVLSPLETVADGEDYISVMDRNLETLRTALDCD